MSIIETIIFYVTVTVSIESLEFQSRRKEWIRIGGRERKLNIINFNQFRSGSSLCTIERKFNLYIRHNFHSRLTPRSHPHPGVKIRCTNS